MIEKKIQTLLSSQKNLLAFSAGGDSTALLFELLKNNIPFDIAIVDYNQREQSKDEINYAKELAKKYNFNCFIHSAKTINKNFEASAREIRYDFFEHIIKLHNYDNLLTAHHLGDRFEWMLMQFCKGAGCVELSGMQMISYTDNYTIIRPFLEFDKSELLDYLHKNNIKYFEDESNLDENIKRNSFRHRYSKPLLEKYLDGIKKSFKYIDEDKKSLIKDIEIKKGLDFAYFKTSKDSRTDIFYIDKYLKTQGYMLSAKEREQLKKFSYLNVGRRFEIITNHNYIFITLVQPNIKMAKDFKERCRKAKINPKLRAFLYKNQEIFTKILD